jgi:hypothetical protein
MTKKLQLLSYNYCDKKLSSYLFLDFPVFVEIIIQIQIHTNIEKTCKITEVHYLRIRD